MLVSVKSRFVFLCMQKCASTSIEAMLRPFCEISMGQPFKHTDYRTYKKQLEPYLTDRSQVDRFETVCLVREPLSWLHSWYRFRSRLAAKDPKHPAHQNNTFGMSFAEFVEAYMSPSPPPFAHVGCQFDLVKDETNNIGVDTLFQYEKIGEFCGYMSGKIGQHLEMQYRNVSPKASYRSHTYLVLDRIKHRVTKSFNIGTTSIPLADVTLPPHLLSAIHEFIPADFALYDRVKQLRDP